MSYKVLYRKYRPSTFSEIVDQKFITDTLKESIINNKISHAYIFSGPKGTGKTSTAKVFAKAINCENPIDGEPCGKCESCLNFGNSPDIIELDAASNNKVDDIRELISNVKLAPTSSKYKIYIIDEAHMLTNSASNAFLLTLEEPPAHDIFILATTNPESLPLTILSRCQQFAFSKISNKALIDKIKYVIKKENIELEEDVIKEIATLADGGLRDALSILDQLITLNQPITIKLLTEQFGVISENQVTLLINDILNSNYQEIFKRFDTYKEFGISEKSFINKFITLLTNEVCRLKMNSENVKAEILKKIVFDIMYLDVSKSEFNYYDVIKMIIISNLDCNSFKQLNTENISREINIKEEVKQDNITASDNYISETIEKKEQAKVIDATNETNNNSQQVNKNNLDEIIKIRINNALAGANLKEKQNLTKNYKDYVEKMRNDNNMYSLLVDTSVGVASDKNVIIICQTEAAANLLNEQLKYIEQNCGFDEKSVVFVSDTEFNKIKDEYVKKKKQNIKYEYIEEPEISSDDELVNLADDIFGADNLIVEE